ncbi:MAG: NAD(P)H-dependent oxidoreductase subunit E [Parvularculaceae bacterium]|nr:NAD(P)H-dependent oxidoreductase subunit E [Parvularculaceae bacterium]
MARRFDTPGMGGSTDLRGSIEESVRPHVGRTGGLITALRAVQARIGYLPPETESVAAAAFNLTRAEVKGVISFYSDFVRAPKGKAVIRLCAAEACQAQGGRQLEREVCRRLAIEPGATSASGDLTLEHVYCLGLCSSGPAAMIDGDLMARATPEKIVDAFDSAGRAKT